MTNALNKGLKSIKFNVSHYHYYRKKFTSEDVTKNLPLLIFFGINLPPKKRINPFSDIL